MDESCIKFLSIFTKQNKFNPQKLKNNKRWDVYRRRKNPQGKQLNTVLPRSIGTVYVFNRTCSETFFVLWWFTAAYRYELNYHTFKTSHLQQWLMNPRTRSAVNEVYKTFSRSPFFLEIRFLLDPPPPAQIYIVTVVFSSGARGRPRWTANQPKFFPDHGWLAHHVRFHSIFVFNILKYKYKCRNRSCCIVL